jgi:hypothetical protein
MERVRWTDERLDKRMSDIDRNFDHVFEELRAERAAFRAEMSALRAESKSDMREFRAELESDMRGLRGELKSEINDLRVEMHAGFAELRTDVSGLHKHVNDVLVKLSVAVVGLLGVGMAALATALLRDGV